MSAEEPPAKVDLNTTEKNEETNTPTNASNDESIGVLINVINDSLKKERTNIFTDAMVSVLNFMRIASDSLPEKRQHFPFAFKIGETFLQKLNKRVSDILNALENHKANDIQFVAQVGFSDISTQKFTDLQKLLDRAGDKKDPKFLTILWQVALVEPAGSQALVKAEFITDKKMDTEELGLFDYELASMNLIVQGPTEDWVEKTFDDLKPFFETARLAGVYKPLLLFRNKFVTQLCSISLAFIVQIILSQKISSYLRTQSREEIKNNILSQTTLDEKFNLFIQEFFKTDDNIRYILLVIAVPMIIWILVLGLGFYTFPKLVPKSGINIGLSSNRYDEYENLFKLIIFTIILSGILIPLFRAIFF